MRKLLNYASQIYLLIFLAPLVLLIIPPTLRASLPFSLQYAFLGLFGSPIAIIILLITLPPLHFAIRIWKWIVGISLVIVTLPFILFYMLVPAEHGIAIIALGLFLLIGFPILVLEVIGLLATYWILLYYATHPNSASTIVQ